MIYSVQEMRGSMTFYIQNSNLQQIWLRELQEQNYMTELWFTKFQLGLVRVWLGKKPCEVRTEFASTTLDFERTILGLDHFRCAILDLPF